MAKGIVKELDEFGKTINGLSPYEGGLTVERDDEKICIRMTREFALSRLEGADYPWYAIFSDKIWLRSNFELMKTVLKKYVMVGEMPLGWRGAYKLIPKKGGYLEISFPIISDLTKKDEK